MDAEESNLLLPPIANVDILLIETQYYNIPHRLIILVTELKPK